MTYIVWYKGEDDDQDQLVACGSLEPVMFKVAEFVARHIDDSEPEGWEEQVAEDAGKVQKALRRVKPGKTIQVQLDFATYHVARAAACS